MNIIQLYQDFSINYLTEGHKHCRAGWVNTECPFCIGKGNPGYHLGYELESNHFVCWRCGWHPIIPTISKLINVNENQVKEIIKNYGGFVYTPHKEKPIKIQVKSLKLPSGSIPLGIKHKTYLESRGFDPDLLEKEWNLMATGPISILDNIDYKFRIIIPFIWDKKQVSFDSRDITGKHPNKYMACPLDLEVIPHKDILYGDQSAWGKTGIGVEGPTDVWRFGKNAVATSGIKYTPKQVRLIAKTFKRFAVCFDGPSETSNEKQAAEQAETLVADLRFRRVDAFKVNIKGDPGGMSQSEADYLVKQLIS